MVRILSNTEAAKREGIRALKARQPDTTWRDIAQRFGTSTRVVAEALKDKGRSWLA